MIPHIDHGLSRHAAMARAARPAMLAAVLGFALLLPGCAGTTAQPLSAVDRATGLAGYRVGAGDKLRITVFNEPTLTGEYNVTSTGAVAFPLIGVVQAGNHTIDDVTHEITGRLAGAYVNDPRVSVEVLNYRPFYILGEVNKPGEYPYASGMTVEQAIAKAGGFTYRANEKTAFLRRQTTSAEHSVSLRSGAPVAVLPGDTIRVGERYF
ncbi:MULTISPECIES: polysaccharide biosynthesis/export family protein [unclassified Novosphingobium]|uniref:polysaccharide biosynthesis/export family protein n=1 Tax=unclassified Novosphingobium TaxID=2644732 RepID=UPI000407F728|nr:MULTISPECIES: polysaccharide biosynthesis/export family protein [unclassified Novosphingobium]PTR12128.1 polysaccharide export outer membrane protein [Novosphingobium sp. GV055]PUB05529.1 polysaccharide export outer membrane protein [Novosphingobium sp. GV061]PUB21762.1 polysaccharide export outer membrane protein [Novosphingobium sp. GV079]PUB43535.1 polysaccharide export outer membrane protein [Novosphingobium sp. GV027]